MASRIAGVEASGERAGGLLACGLARIRPRRSRLPSWTPDHVAGRLVCRRRLGRDALARGLPRTGSVRRSPRDIGRSSPSVGFGRRSVAGLSPRPHESLGNRRSRRLGRGVDTSPQRRSSLDVRPTPPTGGDRLEGLRVPGHPRRRGRQHSLRRRERPPSRHHRLLALLPASVLRERDPRRRFRRLGARTDRVRRALPRDRRVGQGTPRPRGRLQARRGRRTVGSDGCRVAAELDAYRPLVSMLDLP